MLASFLLLVDFNAVSWGGVKFRGRACQRRDLEFEKSNNNLYSFRARHCREKYIPLFHPS
jgi:hypothetical protein